MTKLEIIDKLKKHPIYMENGAGKLAKRWRTTPDVIKECKYLIRNGKENLANTKFKRLFFDIETSPNIGFFWQAGYKLNIPHSNIIREKAIICVSYKWENEDKVYNISWDKGCDKKLVEEFSKILFEADEVVAHYGDRFDIPWLRGRALYHQLPFPTYLKSLDTKAKAYSHFKLNSNSLDYLAKYLNVGGKIEDGGFSNWVKIVMDNDKEALDIMLKYCDNDVIILEDVFHKMENYIKLNTHVGAALGNSKSTCPKCGDKKVTYHKPYITANGTVQRIMKCECGVDYKISNTEWLRLMK